jgi:hypothetical protein
MPVVLLRSKTLKHLYMYLEITHYFGYNDLGIPLREAFEIRELE